MYKRKSLKVFPGSSAVEQATVNRLAGGSNPSRGAKLSLYMSAFMPNNQTFFQVTGIKVMIMFKTSLQKLEKL